jgi:hypothetical protein
MLHEINPQEVDSFVPQDTGSISAITSRLDPRQGKPMSIRKSVITAASISLIYLILVQDEVYPQVLTKAQISEKIKRIEDGTDEFIKYLERKGDNAQARASSPQSEERRRGRSESAGTPTDAQKARASASKDELEDAVNDLEKATDRLRRRYKRVKNHMETRIQVEKVVDEGRELNQLVLRGNYGSEVARVWATLRLAINDLARIYGVKPMAV